MYVLRDDGISAAITAGGDVKASGNKVGAMIAAEGADGDVDSNEDSPFKKRSKNFSGIERSKRKNESWVSLA